jgi:hypothetical protein
MELAKQLLGEDPFRLMSGSQAEDIARFPIDPSFSESVWSGAD